MREIKFRGLRLDNDQWVYGELIRKLSRRGGQWHLIYVDAEDLEDVGVYHKVDAQTVGQFIRNDQYDTEIYEGDIFMNGDSKRIIEMSGGNTLAIKPDRTEAILLSFIIKSNPKNKVIGNIFEK